jgi:hypothetical protein
MFGLQEQVSGAIQVPLEEHALGEFLSTPKHDQVLHIEPVYPLLQKHESGAIQVPFPEQVSVELLATPKQFQESQFVP